MTALEPAPALSGPAVARPRVGVVVLAYEGRDDVLACLASLRDEVAADDVVLVVDNGSHDGTPAAVRAAHPWCEVVENGANLGFAAGNNVGVARVLALGCAWIWLLNQDTVVEPGTLAALRAAAAARPGAGVLQPLVVQLADPTRVDNLGLVPRRWLGVRRVGASGAAADVAATPQPIFGASGAAAFVRGELLARIGMLDSELFLLCEDAELMFRARAAGAEALLVPAARVRHRGGVSAGRGPLSARLRRKFLLQRNTVALALAWWPARRVLAAAPLLAWRALVALALTPFARGHRCWRLWWRYARARRGARAAMRARGLDAWFA